MGFIYQESDLTIIATAGTGPSYGLPGVSKRHRKPQPVVRTNVHLLIAALPNPISAVEKSRKIQERVARRYLSWWLQKSMGGRSVLEGICCIEVRSSKMRTASFLGGSPCEQYILEMSRSGIVFIKDDIGSIGVSIWLLQCRLFVLGASSTI
jgi:hypothetical protein